MNIYINAPLSVFMIIIQTEVVKFSKFPIIILKIRISLKIYGQILFIKVMDGA